MRRTIRADIAYPPSLEKAGFNRDMSPSVLTYRTRSLLSLHFPRRHSSKMAATPLRRSVTFQLAQFAGLCSLDTDAYNSAAYNPAMQMFCGRGRLHDGGSADAER